MKKSELLFVFIFSVAIISTILLTYYRNMVYFNYEITVSDVEEESTSDDIGEISEE